MHSFEVVRRSPAAGLAVIVTLALAGGGSLSACNRDKKASGNDAVAVKTKPVLQPAVLVGSIRIEAGHELPSYSLDEMERRVLTHVKAGEMPPECSALKPEDYQPVKLTPDGKLSGVLLAASEFSYHADPPPPAVRDVTIEDCRLKPSMLVARIGDTLRITNKTNFPMLPGFGAETFNQALTAGQTREIKLDTGGVKSVMCGFSGPCGRTDLVVLGHPHGAVTDAQGNFRIENFPPDETIRINAWHPLFHETFQNVRVQRGEEKRIELVLTPKPPPAPAKAPAPIVSSDPHVINPD